MCKLTYIELCSVYWSLGSVTMLCDPEKSRNLEWDGKLVACVDYGGTFKGAVIVPFGYYPSIRLRKSGNFHLDRWQSTWNFKRFLPVQSRLLWLLGPGSFLSPQLLLFFVLCVCVWVFFFFFFFFYNFMDSPVPCYFPWFFSVALLKILPVHYS